ncbi:unnamed protein product [Ceratitis capitata]|uniref:(Mediterranean fruit fly) hypothetical protein n=1 Tax=Ceratitis capitata TaxID=7213 RepID=A0A811V030_CERCA|nr:unnamed protein product [Ceratitis capitata]
MARAPTPNSHTEAPERRQFTTSFSISARREQPQGYLTQIAELQREQKQHDANESRKTITTDKTRLDDKKVIYHVTKWKVVGRMAGDGMDRETRVILSNIIALNDKSNEAVAAGRAWLISRRLGSASRSMRISLPTLLKHMTSCLGVHISEITYAPTTATRLGAFFVFFGQFCRNFRLASIVEKALDRGKCRRRCTHSIMSS